MTSRAKLILDAVPIGEANARAARDVWRAFGVWAETTIANQLNDLAKAGRVQRKQDALPGGFRWLYWRGSA